MIIDIHTHLGDLNMIPSYFIDGLIDTFEKKYCEATKQKIDKSIISNMLLGSLKDPDGSKLLKQMGQAGISKSVLLIADWGYQMDESVLLEDIYKAYSTVYLNNPDKFIIFTGVDPRRGKEGVTLFEQSVKRYGFRGLKLYPPCGFELDDKRLYPIYEICNEQHLPVLTHTGPSIANMKTEQFFPKSIEIVAKEFKNINFILGHSALLYYDTCAKLPLKHQNIFLEVSGFQGLFQSEDEIKIKLRSLFRTIPNHVLFGSDWPMFALSGSQKRWVDYFINLNVLTTKHQELFFYQNAANVLELKC